MRILEGKVDCGVGNAAPTWPIEQIRKATERCNLAPGTLNVRLDEAYIPRSDFALPVADGRREEFYFERCLLWIGRARVDALIARTSTNYWGDYYIEIMAADHLRDTHKLQDGDTIRVQVRTDDDEELA